MYFADQFNNSSQIAAGKTPPFTISEQRHYSQLFFIS